VTPPRRRGGASRTAEAVAAARAVGLRGIHDPMAARVLSDGRRRLVGALRRTIEGSPSGETVVNALTAGLAGHAALRMHAIDRTVRDGVAAGARQLVVVGAGYDTRAWRIRQLAECRVVEVDLPTTQSAKQRTLADRTPVTPVAFAPADLAVDTLARVLPAAGHDAREPTVWVWEAVAPYLARADVLGTVAAIADLSAPGSRMAMTVARPELVGRGPISTLLSPAARGLFAGIGEPLRSTFDDADVTAVLTDAGFRDVRCTGPDDWARGAGRDPLPDAFAAERLVVARR
jgi:methyltransferase (TIGR00027 family)